MNIMNSNNKYATNQPIDFYTSDNYNLSEIITGFINNAKESIFIMHSIIEKTEIFDSLECALKRKVKIYVISNLASLDTLKKLSKLGAEVKYIIPNQKVYKIHHKCLLIDNCIVLCGSVNLFEQSLHFDEENLFVTRKDILFKAFKKEFVNIWTIASTIKKNQKITFSKWRIMILILLISISISLFFNILIFIDVFN